ncbi:hypothetical protein D7D52_11450 [Nocardia yunnanensis]|uniref:Uncharacterized protein n=1 Tax=Nocardia yunnanensis TaxID=2382165 RepID=A0A386ZB97_9NOCA|nr:hypothetical protein [Nocardia yunnanensis]AYF74374.1 hypothetical protein D7D52_11450 [Nocardia yunnanensis]
MPKHLITLASFTVLVAAIAGCSDHKPAPLAPPTPATAVPAFGGGQIPDVIDVPSASATPTTTTKTTTAVKSN